MVWLRLLFLQCWLRVLFDCLLRLWLYCRYFIVGGIFAWWLCGSYAIFIENFYCILMYMLAKNTLILTTCWNKIISVHDRTWHGSLVSQFSFFIFPLGLLTFFSYNLLLLFFFIVGTPHSSLVYRLSQTFPEYYQWSSMQT